MINAENIPSKLAANTNLTSSLKTVFAVAEKYPDLKANTNFLELQKEISDIESKIAFTRQFYNDTVFKYNNLVMIFPSNLIASLFKFSKKESFEISLIEAKSPEVNM